jgi:HlyD family secretion protein
MTASTTIYVEERQDAIVLSGSAVRFTPDPDLMKSLVAQMMPPAGPDRGNAPSAAPAGKAKTVWVKDDKMGIKPVRITTGIDNGTNIEVLSGLNAGDEVITGMNDGSKKSETTKTDNGPPGPFPF